MAKKDMDGQLLEKTRDEVKEPSKYTCLLHNDNYTTQEFVVYVLKTIFKLKPEDAYQRMMDVHKKGKGYVGSYSYDIARTKSTEVEALAKENEYPLKCTVERI